jgi:MFS family permease
MAKTDSEKTRTSLVLRADEESPLIPFRHPVFTVLWIATVVSNIGTWMQNAAAGWLMTSLNPDPFVVSLVQVATSLPMFILVLPAGALADIVDRRKLLIVVQIAITLLVAAFGCFVWLGQVSPNLLLAFSFLAAAGAALVLPAWQAVVPQLVPRHHLQPAVALNSVGLNVSRAVGPALAGVIIGMWGLAGPFWLNAVSTLGVVAALIWWRLPAGAAASRLPPEQLHRAIQIGLRHAWHNPGLRDVLIRAARFFIFASAYWALLPLVARNQIAGGPELYGILLGAIGVGAVGGAFALPWLRRRLGPDRVVALGTLGTAAAMLLFGLAREPVMAVIASLLAGTSWIAVLTTINVAAQVALPPWVRGRGLAILGAVMFGALTIGSAAWGMLAALVGLPATHYVAAGGIFLALPLLRRWKLQDVGLDLTPSVHWPEPVLSQAVLAEDKQVLVTIDYRIRLEDRDAFVEMSAALERERRRDGAFDWGLFEDVTQPGHVIETFRLDSWIEHLRQHERVTNVDRQLQNAINALDIGGRPKVTHLISVR